MNKKELTHIPVLKEVVCEAFRSVQGPILDATFGGGGHSLALLAQSENNTITALDVDPEAKKRAQEVAKAFPDRFQFFPYNFSQLDALNQHFKGILMDLGVSSFQLDQAERGFSFQKEGPLDMRMDPNAELSAQLFLEKASEEALIEAIRDFGEEPQWRSVVKAILSARPSKFFVTTTSFVQFLLENTPISRSKKPGLHSATRVFQGLRMAVNHELESLSIGLEKAFQCLESNGLLAVISFHSLEDRRVKQFFNEQCGKSIHRLDAEPRQLKQINARLLTKKPIIADEHEVQLNPRARSAKLRILQKLP